MTTKQLLEFFEQYYGERYSGVFLEVMISYLDGFSENFLKTTAEVIIMRFSRIYNKVPDPSIIEKNIDEIRKLMPKPELLSEPDVEERASPEEAAVYLEQMRCIINGKTPMTESLTKTLDNIAGGF